MSKAARQRRDAAFAAEIGSDRYAGLIESRHAARQARPFAERLADAEATRARAVTAAEIASANARIFELKLESRKAS